MAEDLQIDHNLNKEEKYKALHPQLKSLIAGENNMIANLANIAAAIHQTFQFLWTGFYLVDGKELVLGPFQGPVACTRISIGKGVCGTSWLEKRTIMVEDVDQFPGHIACSSASKSEIVVPVVSAGEVKLILDIDSEQICRFDDIDRKYLEAIAELIKEKHYI